DVLRQRFGRLAPGRSGEADLSGVLQGLGKYRRLRVSLPQRVVAVALGAGDAEGVHDLEVLVVLGAIHVPAHEILRNLLVLRVLHHAGVVAGQEVEAAGRPGRIVTVIGALVDVGELAPRRDVDRRRVAGE